MRQVAIVGLGPLGKMIATQVVERRRGKIVAAADVSPDVAGKPLGDVVPGLEGPVVSKGVEAIPNLDEVECAIVATSSDLARCTDTFRFFLSRGVSCVSTCEELLYPWLRHDALAKELDELAKKHGARLLGTGVNPGFLMDTLPVELTAVCRKVTGVKVWRVQDASPRRVPFQKKIGATLDDAAFEAKKKDGSLRHVGLGESLHFVCHYLGLGVVDKWEETLEAVKSDRELTCDLGTIPLGVAAGVRQVARAWHGDRLVAELTFQAAIGQDDPHDRVVIEGEPALDATIKGGVHGDVATVAITINTIERLLEATPGLHTMATIAPTRFAALQA
jgi:4-hydroxy-tetrahydrodipicolinate reductase